MKCDIDEAKKWIKERSATYVLNLKEEKTRTFGWFMSHYNTEVTLIESYQDSEGAKKVENHMASPLAEEFMHKFDLIS